MNDSSASTKPETALSALAFLTGFFPPLSIGAANVAWGLFALAWAVRLWRRQERFEPRSTPMDKPILAFLAAWLAASLAGMAPVSSLMTLPAQSRFMVFYLLVWCSGGAYTEQATRGYVWGAAAAALYGLGQFLLTHLVPAGVLAAAFAPLGERALRYATLAAGRAHGAVHPLTFAETLLPAFFFALGRFLEAERRRGIGRAFAAVALLGTVLILTQSRGPWLAAAAGVALATAIHPRRRRLILPAAVFATVLLMTPSLRERVETLSKRHRDESTVIRLTLWKGGFYILRRHPGLGVGPGQIEPATELHKTRPDFPYNPYGFENDLHNQFLHHAAERGAVGLAVLGWLLAAAAWMGWKAWRTAADGGRRALGLALALSFATFPIMNLTERAFDDAEVALIFWILAACAVNTRQGSPASGAFRAEPEAKG